MLCRSVISASLTNLSTLGGCAGARGATSQARPPRQRASASEQQPPSPTDRTRLTVKEEEDRIGSAAASSTQKLRSDQFCSVQLRSTQLTAQAQLSSHSLSPVQCALLSILRSPGHKSTRHAPDSNALYPSLRSSMYALILRFNCIRAFCALPLLQTRSSCAVESVRQDSA